MHYYWRLPVLAPLAANSFALFKWHQQRRKLGSMNVLARDRIVEIIPACGVRVITLVADDLNLCLLNSFFISHCIAVVTIFLGLYTPQLNLPMWTKAVMGTFICFHALIELILALHMHRNKLFKKGPAGNNIICVHKCQLIFNWCCYYKTELQHGFHILWLFISISSQMNIKIIYYICFRSAAYQRISLTVSSNRLKKNFRP